MNDVYDIGKLCTEDPIPVSKKLSLKFHAFFRTVVVKGEVLGKVEHFYWKKEYQARGVPHYHVLLWIGNAPVFGRDDPEKVLAWIQERVTCHIPDTKPTNVVHIASEDKSVLVIRLLPGVGGGCAGLDSLIKFAKTQN